MLCIQRAYGSDDLRIDCQRAAASDAQLWLHSDRTVCAPRLPNAVSHVTRLSRLRGGVSAFALVLAVGCEAVVNEVRVEPGTAPLKPVFVLTDTTGRGASGTIYGLSVVPCGADTAVWQITALGSNGPPSRLEYGVAPTGYTAPVGPGPLRIGGCYDVFVTDGRRARFRVDPAGRVIVEASRNRQSRDTTPR